MASNTQKKQPRLKVYVRAPKNTQSPLLSPVPLKNLDSLYYPSHTQNNFAVFKLSPLALISTGAKAFLSTYSDQWGPDLLYNPNADAHLTRVELATANALNLSVDSHHLLATGITTNPAVGAINLPIESKNIDPLQAQTLATILICLKSPQNITPHGYAFNL